MNAPLELAKPDSQDAAALLQQRLVRLEALLQQSRDRVMLAMDREIEAVRGWLEQLPAMDPTLALHRLPDERAEVSLEGMLTQPPMPTNGKIVPFLPLDKQPVLEEPPVDPRLEEATMDELNAALAAAFSAVAEK